MDKIMVVAEHRQGNLTAETFEVIAAAVELKQAKDMSLITVVLSNNPTLFSSKLNIAGVDEIIEVTIQTNEFQTDIYESTIEALLEEFSPAVVLIPHSIDAWSYAPVLATKKQYGLATDVFGLKYDDDNLIAIRAAYNEKVHVEVEFPNKDIVIITIRANSYKAIEEVAVVKISSFKPPTNVAVYTEHKKFVEPQLSGDVDITQAKFMLSIGRGIEDEDNIEQFEELADTMDFTLGCSRPVADNGWLPKSRQVGQSGKVVSNCSIYLAFGISGSVQHMAGMKHVPNIIAVNTDSEAAIFTIARYGVVADMFDIVEELQNHFE